MSITGLMKRLSLIGIDAIWQLSLGCLLMRTIASFLRYTGYLNFINGHISRVLLLILCCSMFCCTLLYVHFSIAIILMGTRELIALLKLSPWCLVIVERLFLTVPRGCLQFVIVVFSDHTHLLFLYCCFSI